MEPKLIGEEYFITQVVEKGKTKGKCKKIKMGDYLCGYCNNKFSAAVGIIKYGQKSCGCQQHKTKNPYYKTYFYSTWNGIKNRCYNKNNKHYNKYGGRGITMCDRWKNGIHGLENFISDMGERPSSKHSIDRIDNNKGYNSYNCKWATQKQQCRNKRNNISITYKEETKTLTEWSEILKLKFTTIYNRIFTYKWSIEKAFETPIKNKST